MFFTTVAVLALFELLLVGSVLFGCGNKAKAKKPTESVIKEMPKSASQPPPGPLAEEKKEEAAVPAAKKEGEAPAAGGEKDGEQKKEEGCEEKKCSKDGGGEELHSKTAVKREGDDINQLQEDSKNAEQK